ncbi:hypothetical protein KI387_032950, partial [Taxus chinensis]
RGLIRANTMPSKTSNHDVPATAETDNGFKRSITERRKGNKTHDNEDIQGTTEKMSDRKKMKIMKKIAMVKDGTVEFDVNGSARYAADLFGPSIETPRDVEEEEDEDDGEKRSVPPLQIAMLIVGTRGDVQPFVAIGKHLQEYGHRVRLATHSNFEEFVLTAGLEFYPLGGDPKVLAEYMVKNKGFLPSGPSEIAIQRKQLKAIIYSLLPACTEAYGDSGVKFRAEAILANPPAYGHVHVAEALKVPLHIFFTMPWTPTSKFPHPLSRVKQPAGYRLSYQVVDSLIWLGIRDIINDFRKKKLKLRPVTYLSGTQGSITDLPTGYIWSPHLVPKPEDWGPKVDVVGFCFLNLASDFTPEESLLKWLEGGKNPIYVGFGSLPVQDPQGMTKIIVEALKKTGQRGIINKGWGGLGNLTEPHEFVYTLDNCPHDWLFPRCAAVVHHGGAGTTAAGLKAACPTTIVPFFGDQPFWGERVHARGLGPPPIPVDQFSLDKLVSAIDFMLDPKSMMEVVLQLVLELVSYWCHLKEAFILFHSSCNLKITNNTAEYEALILGLQVIKEQGVKNLLAHGDAELIVKQVRNLFHVNNRRLKHYRNQVWDSIEFLDAFSIEVMPREENTRADSLAVLGSLLIPHPDFSQDKFTIKMIHIPSVLDNTRSDNFPHQSVPFHEGAIKEEEANRDGCIKLKGNKILKGLVSLEELFDKQDKYVKFKASTGPQQSVEYEKINIRSSTDPQLVNIGKFCTPEEKKKVLQVVTGSEMLSMLDGFSGYNQVEVNTADQHKTAFTTPWGTFAYKRMPFRLLNASATF